VISSAKASSYVEAFSCYSPFSPGYRGEPLLRFDQFCALYPMVYVARVLLHPPLHVRFRMAFLPSYSTIPIVCSAQSVCDTCCPMVDMRNILYDKGMMNHP
jgi:hypothetical protein